MLHTMIYEVNMQRRGSYGGAAKVVNVDKTAQKSFFSLLFLLFLFSLTFLFFLLVFLLLGFIKYLGSNPIQVTLTTLSYPSSTIIRLLQYTDLLQ